MGQVLGQCCVKNENNIDPYQQEDPMLTESSNAGNKEVKKIISTQEKYDDFNRTGDDVKRISEKELKKLNRYQQFEKKFPFYLMDVNGFIMRIR